MFLRANGEQRQNFIKITHDPQSSCLTLILKSWTSTVNDEKVQPQKTKQSEKHILNMRCGSPHGFRACLHFFDFRFQISARSFDFVILAHQADPTN